MALFHFYATHVKRSAGQSAIASAAYRAGEKLFSEYYGEGSDYTRKGGVICSEILLPPHAPPEYADRQTLWNAVEKVERGKNAQLAYSFDIALQNEFSLDENIALARQFLFEQLVSRGIIADFSVHQPDKEDGGIFNPHFHVLCPIRPLDEDGRWGLKQRREYVLGEDGNRIRDDAGNDVFNAVPTTDWGRPETLESWREAWAELCNTKQYAEAHAFLMAQKLYTPDDLEACLTSLSGRIDELKNSMTGKFARMKELEELLRMTGYYAAGKPVYDKLNTIKFKKSRERYANDHENNMRLFYIAQRKLKPHFSAEGKLPLTAWRKEQTKLQQEYEAGQAELSPLYADVKKLWNIRFCVEKVLQERRPQAQTKKHGQEL